MAQMHPRNGPAEGTASAAERQLYGILRERLGDEWHVIHGAERYFKAKNGRLVRGEIDFLLLHPDYGVVVLEAKGGRIVYDGDKGQWLSLDRQNVPHPLLPSPFQQVNDSHRNLKYFLSKAPETKPFSYALARAVWFFSMEWQPHHLAEFPDELILDNRHLDAPQPALESIFAYAGIKREPGKLSPEAVAAFIGRFDPEFAPPTLADEIRIDNRTIDYLTQSQCARLEALLRYRRCLIPGEAGSGKTMLAFETARLLAGRGWRTLFVCVNEFQATWLQEKHDIECDAASEAFDIFDARSLCAEITKQAKMTDSAGVPAQIVSARGQAHLAQTLMRGIERLLRVRQDEWRYDALIIDEGQDIEPQLLQALARLLRDPKTGYCVVWYDARQRIDFDDEWHFPFALHQVPALTENLRNSRAVRDAMAEFNPDLVFFPFNGPNGRPIAYVDPAHYGSDPDAATQTALHAVLQRLIGQEGISPSAIMVVTCRANDASRWKAWRGAFADTPLRPLTQWRATKIEERDQFVKLSTIRAAKGLESDVVILVETDGVAAEPPVRRNKLLYVAVSRARHHLIVLGSPADIAPAQ